MTITTEHLVGDPEVFDETIRHLISRNWDDTKTDSTTPKFMSPQGHDSVQADTTDPKSANDWKAFKNQNFIRFKEIDTIRQNPIRQGNIKTTFVTIVNIDIFAETPHLLFLFKEEVNRIIWENLPSNASASRIRKSNNTEDSAIATFDRQQIEWIQIGEFEDLGITMQLAGEIGCVWQKSKS